MSLIFLLFSLWDAKIEDKIVQDRIGMNLLYVQVNLTDFIIVVKWDGLQVLKSVLRLFKTWSMCTNKISEMASNITIYFGYISQLVAKSIRNLAIKVQ